MSFVLGAIFAGGTGRRLGGKDKGQLELDGKTFYSIVTNKLEPQTDQLVVISPEPPVWLRHTQARHIPDVMVDELAIGPAGALLAGLRELNSIDPTGTLLTAPVDAPFFPDNLRDILADHLRSSGVAIVEAGGRQHPVFGLWSAQTLPEIERLIIEDGERALHQLVEKVGGSKVPIETTSSTFLNVNTPDDLAAAQKLASE